MANGFKLTAELLLQAPTKANVSAVTSELRAMLKDVDVNVNAKVGSTYTKQVKAANTATSELTDVIEYADTTMYKFGHQVGLAAKRFAAFTVSTVGLIELMRAFGTGIKDAVAFQHEMVKIAQVSGKVTSGVKELAAEVTRLSINLGTQSNKLLEASQILVQAGLSVDDTKTSLEALAKTSISPTFDDIIDTTEGAIAIFSQFKIQAEDLESTLSSVNAVAGKFAVESSDIITTVRRTGGAFKAAGGDLNELIALFTSVRATTRESAESIATGFRTIFTRLQRSRTIEFLDNLGIKLRDTNNQFIGPYKAIEELSRALNGIKGTDPRFSQIIEELGGFRQISKVIPLITEFSEAQKALTVAQLGSKSLAIDAAKAQESLGIQFTKVGERFDALIRKFADTNTFKSLVKVGLSLANAFIDVAESLETVLPLLVTFGAVKLSTLSKFYVPGIGSGLKGESATPARVRRLNSGGRVFDGGIRIPSLEKGTDKIPAMLSKDEFVIKSSSAKKIGYSNLERLNKFGYFSKGGSPSYIPSSGEDVMNTVYKSVDIIVKQIAEKIGLAINPDDIKSMIQRASGSSFRNDAGKPLMSAGAAGQHETLDGSAILLKDTINVFADNIAELGLSTKKIREFLAHEIGHIIDYNSPGERSSNVLDLSPVKSGFSENISTIKYNNATQEQIAKHNEYMLRNSEVFADLFATLVSDIDSQSPKRLQKMKETVVDKGFPSGFDSTIREIVSSRFNAGRMQEFALGEPEPTRFTSEDDVMAAVHRAVDTLVGKIEKVFNFRINPEDIRGMIEKGERDKAFMAAGVAGIHTRPEEIFPVEKHTITIAPKNIVKSSNVNEQNISELLAHELGHIIDYTGAYKGRGEVDQIAASLNLNSIKKELQPLLNLLYPGQKSYTDYRMTDTEIFADLFSSILHENPTFNSVKEVGRTVEVAGIPTNFFKKIKEGLAIKFDEVKKTKAVPKIEDVVPVQQVADIRHGFSGYERKYNYRPDLPPLNEDVLSIERGGANPDKDKAYQRRIKDLEKRREQKIRDRRQMFLDRQKEMSGKYNDDTIPYMEVDMGSILQLGKQHALSLGRPTAEFFENVNDRATGYAGRKVYRNFSTPFGKFNRRLGQNDNGTYDANVKTQSEITAEQLENEKKAKKTLRIRSLKDGALVSGPEVEEWQRKNAERANRRQKLPDVENTYELADKINDLTGQKEPDWITELYRQKEQKAKELFLLLERTDTTPRFDTTGYGGFGRGGRGILPPLPVGFDQPPPNEPNRKYKEARYYKINEKSEETPEKMGRLGKFFNKVSSRTIEGDRQDIANKVLLGIGLANFVSNLTELDDSLKQVVQTFTKLGTTFFTINSLSSEFNSLLFHEGKMRRANRLDVRNSTVVDRNDKKISEIEENLSYNKGSVVGYRILEQELLRRDREKSRKAFTEPEIVKEDVRQSLNERIENEKIIRSKLDKTKDKKAFSQSENRQFQLETVLSQLDDFDKLDKAINTSKQNIKFLEAARTQSLVVNDVESANKYAVNIQDEYKVLQHYENEKKKQYENTAKTRVELSKLQDKLEAQLSARQELRAKRERAVATARSQIKAAQLAERFSPVVSLASTLGIAGGDIVSEYAKKDIKNRSSLYLGAQTAQGAAFGGQLGFEAGKIGGTTGKIAGVVIGTVGGALYSFLKATEEVSNQLKKISFDKEFKAVSKSFEGIASGADNLSANIGTALISFNKSFDTYLKTTGDIRQNLKGDLTQLSVPLDTIIKKAIAQSKGDTSAFNALIDQTTIKNFAGITDQNVSDVNRSIYEQLTKAAEDAKKVIVNADAQSVVNAYQASLDNLNNTFNEYIESVNSASNSLSILTDGTVSFAEVSDDVSKMSPQRFSQMVASASRTAQFSGQFGQKIVDRSQQAYEASRVIPYVLREALTSGGLAGNGLDYSIVEYFKGKKNADNTPKYDDQIIAIIQSSVSKTLGAELKPENLAKKLIEDFDGTVKEFREALESASKGLTIFSKFNVENLKQIQEFYQKKKEIDDRILELSLKEIDIRESIQDQIAEATGGSRGRVSDAFNRERAREMLGAFGNLEGNVDAIAAELAASQRFIQQNEKSVASGTASSDLADRFNREIDKRDAFIKVLDFYTDVTKTAAEAQEKFTAKLNSLKVRQSILDTRVFGTREQKRNQERVLENVRSFAMTANPDSVDESVKQEVFDLLKSIGNTSIPELTGNRTAKELLDTARYNDSYMMARSYGADDATARTYADSQVNMGNQPDVQQAVIELANAQSTSLNAINALDTHYNGIRDTILDKLNDILTNFTTNLSAILAREEVRGLQQQQQDTLAKLTGYSQKNATLRNAVSFLGSNSNNPNLVNEESLTKLVASTSQLRKDFETLKTLGNIPLGRDAETFKILTGSVEQFYNQRRQMGIAGGGTGNESPRLSIKEFDSVLETLRTTLASKYDANFAQDIVTQMRQNESLAPVNSFVKAESISSVFEEAFNKVRVGKIAELGEAQKRTNEISSLLGVSSSTLYQYLSSGISKEMTLAFEGTKVSFNAMNDEIVKLNDSLRTINATLNAIPPQSVPRPPIRRQAGGEVPGIGSGDTIPSLLEPGEFVLNRNAVRAVGVGRLTSLNNGISRFQTGGLVGRKINTIEDASAYARDYARETLGIKDGNFSALRGMFTFAYMKPEDAIAAREKIGYIPQAFFRRGEKKIYIQKDKNIDASIMNHEIAHAIDARFGNDSTVASELQGSRIQQFMNNSGYSDIYNRMLDTQEMEYRNTGSMNPSDIDKWKKARSRPAEAFATFMQQDTEARKRLIGELFPAEATSNFNASVTKFSSSAASLATALNSFPRELTLTANHRVEIVITGAQALQNMLPAVTELIVAKGKEQINNMLKTKFPTVGLMP